MKLLERNDRQGLVKVMADSAEDLWYLHTIIAAGDVCSGESEYKYKLGDGREGKSQVVKKRVYVSIAVEKTEYAKHAGQLRVTGKVVEGSEEVPRGSYHSLDVAPGDRIAIVKERWLDFQREKLEEALSARANALVLLFDRETAIIAMLKPTGHEVLLRLHGDVPRKGVDEARQHSFYKDIVKQLGELAARHQAETVIAASPSFWKEYLEKELTPELRRVTAFTAVSAVEEQAISEILTRPELQQALQQQRSARELVLLGKVLEALAKDRLVYGRVDLEEAVLAGNVSELVVSENAIAKAREDGSFEQLEGLMRTASDVKAAVRLLSTDDAMGKVDGLGGIVGIKRW